MQKLFLRRLRYRHCCLSIIMRPSGYFIGPNLAHRAIWVWDPWSTWCWAFTPQNCIHFKTRRNFFPQLPQTRVLKFCPELEVEHYLIPYSTSAVTALVWQMYRLLVNLPNFSSWFSKFVLALFFSHVFEFLSQMKIPNLGDSLCQR